MRYADDIVMTMVASAAHVFMSSDGVAVLLSDDPDPNMFDSSHIDHLNAPPERMRLLNRILDLV